MKIYRVGGSVRDELLGLTVADRDYVVVGTTPQALLDKGFRPVGKDFPVFLHPQTQEEYALARTERKTAPGYAGFAFHAAPDVTLEQDLARRDFTINAMAVDDAGTLIDPHHGADDLKAGLLRHVSPAFTEDPVRILRCARFAARFGFSIAPETMALMRTMSANGEVDALVPERVWQELARGLMEDAPGKMFDVLDRCGALAKVLPELAPYQSDACNFAALERAAILKLSLPVRFAALAGAINQAQLAALVLRARVPNDCRDLAQLHARHGATLATAMQLDAPGLADLIQGADGLRQEARFLSLIAVAHVFAAKDSASAAAAKLMAKRLSIALSAARTVDAGAIAKQHADPQSIAAAVKVARIAAIAHAVAASPSP
jgi:tRNA nucleotidyltransferase (CCA-adding enzyme)